MIRDFQVKKEEIEQGEGSRGFSPKNMVVFDGTYDALFAVGATPDFWIARPIELPGSRPLRFEGSQDVGSRLIEWPVNHSVKVLCFYHPDDPEALRTRQASEIWLRRRFIQSFIRRRATLTPNDST